MTASNLSTSTLVSPAVDKIKGASHEDADTFINQHQAHVDPSCLLAAPLTANASPSRAVPTFPEFDAFFAPCPPSQDKGKLVQDTSSPMPCATPMCAPSHDKGESVRDSISPLPCVPSVSNSLVSTTASPDVDKMKGASREDADTFINQHQATTPRDPAHNAVTTSP